MFFINAKIEQLFGRERLMAAVARKPRARTTRADKTPLAPPQQAQQATPAPSSQQAAAKPQQRSARAQQGSTAAVRRKQEEEASYGAAWPKKAAEVPLTADEQQTYNKLRAPDQETPLNPADAALFESAWPKSNTD